MNLLKSSLVITSLFVASLTLAATKKYLGQFDFDYECKSAAELAGYSDFEYSPLDGACYGIK